ncbi:MAG: FAD-binding protein, partial [Candidatus Nitrosocosmicus sp.]
TTTAAENTNPLLTHSCDVLIIGSGSAGLRAAIEAHDAGANVFIISKSRKGDPHTVLARGGINAALGTMDPEDNWMIHAADTLREGGFLADYERVELLCKSAPNAINELVNWGARFHREKDGRLTQRFFGAHTYRRTVFYEDWTGQEMVRVLLDQVNQRKIMIVDDIYITKLLKLDDFSSSSSNHGDEITMKITGALGIDIKIKKVVTFQCKSLILAAGGYTRVYEVSSSRSFENYGEGMALAYEAGADLVDMEMVQFHPTGMIWPENARGTLATEAIRGEGGILLNSKNERFMKRYYPEKMELGPRDVVARANYNEILEGRGTEHGGVWLDITHLSKEKILDRLPTMYQQFKDLDGIDISKDKMEVGPTAHYSMGGVVVDIKCRTKIRGLFAVGEVISQIHGANRLGGNSLLDTQVFGKIAGSEAAILAKEVAVVNQEKPGEGGRQQNLAVKKELLNNEIYVVKEPLAFRNEIQKVMKENAGIIRDETKLQNGLKRILELKENFYSKDNVLKESEIDDQKIVLSFEVKSSFVICEALIRSAIMRTESRGAHYRSDFPELDDEKWKVNIYCRRESSEEIHQEQKQSPAKRACDKMILFKEPVKEIKGPLTELIKSYKKADHHREFE